MKLEEAEKARHELQAAIGKVVNLNTGSIEVLIVPSLPLDYDAFYQQWRNSTYVAALATFGHCDMKLVVCDSTFVEKEFETVQEFLRRIGFYIDNAK